MNMPPRLSLVGDLERPDHSHLPPGAVCYFWGEYTPPRFCDGAPWDFSATNQLIFNFKKKKGQAGYQYKRQAIAQVAQAFSTLYNWDALLNLRPAFIPIPPSKARTDEMYDGRMLEMLRELALVANKPLDIRDCLSFDGRYAASHESDDRPSPNDLYDALSFDAAVGLPLNKPGAIFLYDDMLTSGAHYVAASRKLSEFYPGVQVFGQFIARRRFPNPFADFEAI